MAGRVGVGSNNGYYKILAGRSQVSPVAPEGRYFVFGQLGPALSSRVAPAQVILP